MISLKLSAMDLTSSCRKSASETSSGGSRIKKDYSCTRESHVILQVIHQRHLADVLEFYKRAKHEVIWHELSATDLTSSCRKSTSETSSGGSRIKACYYLTKVVRHGSDVILQQIQIRDIQRRFQNTKHLIISLKIPAMDLTSSSSKSTSETSSGGSRFFTKNQNMR